MICLDLLDHYRRFIQPNGFKAQVVGVSRAVAATYKETLDRLNGPESAIIMSVGHNEKAHIAQWRLTKEQQDHLVERFKDASDPLSLLVVCDMLLTGFDAPVLQVQYLDSPFREHTLLQSIARVNRPMGDTKTYGLVVDYWGVSDTLQEALAIFAPADVKGALTPKVDELPRLQSRHRAAMRIFDAVRDKNDLDACVRVLEPEDVRTDFEMVFRAFAQSMDMLLPDPRAIAYKGDLGWLGKIRGTARSRYHDPGLDLSACGEKVRQIINDAIIADHIEVLIKEVPLLSKEFDEKVDALKTDEAKASEMEHAVRHEIHVRLEENPAFYQSLRERLEDIIERHRQARLSAAEQLKLMQALRREIQGEQKIAEGMDLRPTGFAIYGLLEKARPATVAEPSAPYNEANRHLAGLIDEAIEPLTGLVDWWQKDSIQKEMRSKIKRHLWSTGMERDEAERVASQIVDLARVRRER